MTVTIPKAKLREIAEVDKRTELDLRYPDLLPTQIDRALEMKRLFMRERGTNGARSNRSPQDIAVDIVKEEISRGITLNADRFLALMYVTGNPVSGDENRNHSFERNFKEQQKDNAVVAGISTSVVEATAEQTK